MVGQGVDVRGTAETGWKEDTERTRGGDRGDRHYWRTQKMDTRGGHWGWMRD